MPGGFPNQADFFFPEKKERIRLRPFLVSKSTAYLSISHFIQALSRETLPGGSGKIGPNFRNAPVLSSSESPLSCPTSRSLCGSGHNFSLTSPVFLCGPLLLQRPKNPEVSVPHPPVLARSPQGIAFACASNGLFFKPPPHVKFCIHQFVHRDSVHRESS